MKRPVCKNVIDKCLKGVYLIGFYMLALPTVQAQGYRHSAPISISGVHNRVISHLDIQNPEGICIHLANCSDITITDCRLGPAKATGIELYNCSNITIVHNYISYVSTGVYAIASKTIKVDHNQIKNVQGPYPRGAMVQFDHVSGEGNSVSDNRFENVPGQSNPEDAISMYVSEGTASSPIRIYGNWIRGGGPSKSGGGIMLGDNGGAFIVCRNNTLVDPGQYGIAISSGTNMVVQNNKIYGRRKPFTNVGIYVWNQYKTACSGNVVSNNLVNWTNAKGEHNNGWNSGNCGVVRGWETNVLGANIDESILPQQILGTYPKRALHHRTKIRR